MNRNLARAIVGCLCVSASPAADVERLASFSAGDWARTLEWLDHSGLALLLWDRLNELRQANVVPSGLGSRLKKNLADHCLRIAEMSEEFNSINRCLEGAGIRYAALKSFALIPEYCPDACLRTTYDHDYLLPVDSLECAEQALRAIGYMRQAEAVDHPLVYFHQIRPPGRPQSRDDLYSPKFPRTVEVHFRLWDDNELKIPLRFPADPLSRSEIRRLSPAELGLGHHPRFKHGLSFYALSKEDELIFQVLHAFRHILQNWCRLCSLRDIAWFLEHRLRDHAFWDRFCESIGATPLLPEITGVVFSLSASLFGATLSGNLASRTTETLPKPVALWLTRYGTDLAISNFSDTKFGLFLHREFVQDGAAWREIEKNRLFPLHRPNRPAATPSPKLALRLLASWKQGLYVLERVRHHLVGATQYGLESRRWARARNLAR